MFRKLYYLIPVALAACAFTARADLIHEYSFNDGTVNDSVGGANGTLVGTLGGGPTVSGGQLQLNNPNFSPTGSADNYLSLPASILPSSGSATIEEWFTFTGSGFFTESWAFSNNQNDSNPPGASNGQYLMGVISAPQPGSPLVGQTLAAHIFRNLSLATAAVLKRTPMGRLLVLALVVGYLDDGETFMSATVIDGVAGTLSYYLYDISAGGIGGLQQTITAIPLSSYSFSNAYLGRSAFAGDDATSGAIDEFRIYDDAQSADQVAADFAAGPNVVPEPASMALLGLGGFAMMLVLRRRSGTVS